METFLELAKAYQSKKEREFANIVKTENNALQQRSSTTAQSTRP